MTKSVPDGGENKTDSEGFYTMKGYTLLGRGSYSSAEEDYLEMIARLLGQGVTVRATELARRLHVRTSSVTKMVQQLRQAGLVHAQKYGEITLTPEGASLGAYLLHRHEVLHRFLCLLNHSDNELEQVEKIEHYLNHQTIHNLERLLSEMQKEQRGDKT